MKLETINIQGDEMPILCTFSVLEKLQNEFGTVTEFSQKLIPVKKNKGGAEILSGMPDIHAVVFALPLFLKEGIDAYNDEHKIKLEQLTTAELFRKVSQGETARSLIDIALALYKELWRSINAPKPQPPAETNQKKK